MVYFFNEINVVLVTHTQKEKFLHFIIPDIKVRYVDYVQ